MTIAESLMTLVMPRQDSAYGHTHQLPSSCRTDSSISILTLTSSSHWSLLSGTADRKVAAYLACTGDPSIAKSNALSSTALIEGLHISRQVQGHIQSKISHLSLTNDSGSCITTELNPCKPRLTIDSCFCCRTISHN